MEEPGIITPFLSGLLFTNIAPSYLFHIEQALKIKLSLEISSLTQGISSERFVDLVLIVNKLKIDIYRISKF